MASKLCIHFKFCVTEFGLDGLPKWLDRKKVSIVREGYKDPELWLPKIVVTFLHSQHSFSS
jgi:hypothetical protein